MASAINKVTGQYIRRGLPKDIQIGESSEGFTMTADWIINPTPAEYDQYIYKTPIATLKQSKISEIQLKTDTLLEAGFSYDSKTWGSAPKDMRAWNFFASKILTKKERGATDEQIFPMANKLRDKSGTKHDCPNHDYLDALLDAGEVFYEGIMEAHWTLVDQVNAIDTGTYDGDKTAIEGIIDNR
jgi:hypothetical protein